MNDIIGKIENLIIDFSDLKKTIDKIEKDFGDNKPFKWDLYIQKVDNGFILTPPDKDQDIEIVKCDSDEKETMSDLLYSVYEYFCSMDTQHSKWVNENLKITWDKEGSHYEPPEKCPLCDDPKCHWTLRMEKYMKEIVEDNKNYMN